MMIRINNSSFSVPWRESWLRSPSLYVQNIQKASGFTEQSEHKYLWIQVRSWIMETNESEDKHNGGGVTESRSTSCQPSNQTNWQLVRNRLFESQINPNASSACGRPLVYSLHGGAVGSTLGLGSNPSWVLSVHVVFVHVRVFSQHADFLPVQKQFLWCLSFNAQRFLQVRIVLKRFINEDGDWL